jgi:thiol-disulfide isomerase/thioredoxin
MMKQLLVLTILSTISFSGRVFAGDIPPGIITPEPFQAPSLEAKDIDGQPFSLVAQRGKWVFVHFWASWCGPCRREVPAINKMQQLMSETTAGKALVIAFINTAEDEDTIFSFLSVHGPQLRPLMDSDGQATEQWKPRGLPATFLVDPNGIVRYQALGGRPWQNENYINFLQDIMNPQLNKQ